MEGSNGGDQSNPLISGRMWPPAPEGAYDATADMGLGPDTGTPPAPPEALGIQPASAEAFDEPEPAGSLLDDDPVRMARCMRCHIVFDPSISGTCTRCGAAYVAPARPSLTDGTFAEQYLGTDFVEPVVEAPTQMPRKDRRIAVMVGIGTAMIVVALIIGFMASNDVFTSKSTPEPGIVAAPSMPSPTPTLPASVAVTLEKLTDRNLCAHVVVQSRMDLDGRVTGRSATQIVKFEGDMCNGNESGTVTQGSSTKEFRFVDGVLYIRTSATANWTVASSVPTYWILNPLFNVSKSSELQLVGAETVDGKELNHFRSTPMWRPDARIAFMDISALPIQPVKDTLDIWCTADGTIVKANYSGVDETRDGSGVKLLDVETTYIFTNVGVEQPIGSPAPPTPAHK